MIYQVGKLRLVPKLEDAEKTIKRLEDDLAQAVRATVLQHETICNLSDEIDRLRADLVELQSRYDQLTGEKFSDRCHTALRDRAKRAELERNKLQGMLDRIKSIIPDRLDPSDETWILERIRKIARREEKEGADTNGTAPSKNSKADDQKE